MLVPDTNYGSTGDSAENIDSALRIKHQALSYTANDGWEDAITPDCLHMSDYADEYGYKQGSASFIDGVIVEDTEYTDRILLLIDAFAWNGGGFQSLNIDAYGQAHGGVARSMPFGDGFCTIAGHKYFLLSDQNVKSGNVNMNTVRSRFNYAADIYGREERRMADITFIICWVHRRSILPTERQLMIAICRLVSFQNTVSVKIMNCTRTVSFCMLRSAARTYRQLRSLCR